MSSNFIYPMQRIESMSYMDKTSECKQRLRDLYLDENKEFIDNKINENRHSKKYLQNSSLNSLEMALHTKLLSCDIAEIDKIISVMLSKFNSIQFYSEYDYALSEISSFLKYADSLSVTIKLLKVYEAIDKQISDYQKEELSILYNNVKRKYNSVKKSEQERQAEIKRKEKEEAERQANIEKREKLKEEKEEAQRVEEAKIKLEKEIDEYLSKDLSNTNKKLLEVCEEIAEDADEFVTFSVFYKYRHWCYINGYNENDILEYIPTSKKQKLEQLLISITNNLSKYPNEFRRWFDIVFSQVYSTSLLVKNIYP